MENDRNGPFQPARRGFLKAGGAAAVAATALGKAAAAQALPVVANDDPYRAVEPFFGPHQGGIVTPQQSHTYVVALDLTTDKRDDVIGLLRAWTDAASRLTRGEPAASIDGPDDRPAGDSGEALGLGAARLTITFGFGPGLFALEGKDRYGLANRRPAALVDLPRFNGDQLVPEKTGGDLFIQACANDAQVAFHAVRQLARIGSGIAHIRWGQAGFLSGPRDETPRNLMGFKDGTNNPSIKDTQVMDEFVWAGSEGPGWMQGGTYTVVRRIRITLEHWDQMERGFQESVFGRQKKSGAPLGKAKEFDALDLEAADKDGNPVIPDNSHVRLSNRATNNGAQILRRSYSYNDGTNFYIERWPPWRQETEYDAGLIFIAHQRDPRTGFIPINERLAKFDMMNQFTTHIGSAIFACPPGARPGSFIGAALFES
ncbi:deferrochelatase/peroxidase EfeB [Trinickia symbiotica]|uniref:Deferrochelatase n=1 Tax=Trinickia symbiotica TaxID=863227 RepID=A0A2N7WQD1_9BURK|nr:iron uptake transporter deferrochelatase/peroxidase subunit [Trinickia symbiotica]PMS31656.1 deferrochelatase/peroxidase EfeB [Trinickia symbiotica]PPK41422.1 deferrochelatase/peroxidase EfeB [Trinickia symbiotica]